MRKLQKKISMWLDFPFFLLLFPQAAITSHCLLSYHIAFCLQNHIYIIQIYRQSEWVFIIIHCCCSFMYFYITLSEIFIFWRPSKAILIFFPFATSYLNRELIFMTDIYFLFFLLFVVVVVEDIKHVGIKYFIRKVNKQT